MFVIVYNNSVILGPMRWNRFRFENQIQEECEFAATLPDTNSGLAAITVSPDIQILPIQGTENPPFNPRIEYLHGPFWQFTDQTAIMRYQVESMNIDAVKNMLKEQVTAERWNKENSGVAVTVNSVEYTFATNKETRALLQNAVLNLESVLWKIDRETWVTLMKSDAESVLAQVLTHVQGCFDWEFSKFNEIDACESLAELSAVVITETA